MIIERMIDPVFGINTYIFIENRHIIFIDPVSVSNYKNAIDNGVIDFAILTHEHYDHICGVNELKKEFALLFYCGEKAARGLIEPTVNMSRYIDFLKSSIPFGSDAISACDYSCEADLFLKDSEIIDWEGHKLLVKETPGHSAGSISILLDGKYLFSGDTVFKDYQTATRLPGGSTKAFRTITEPWLRSLPQDVIVYPGHADSFLLAERFRNSY